MSEKKVRESKGAEGQKQKKGGSDGKADAGAAARRGGQRSGDVGRALRSVYDETLREDVPDDFLNLLGKLS